MILHTLYALPFSSVNSPGNCNSAIRTKRGNQEGKEVSHTETWLVLGVLDDKLDVPEYDLYL